MSPVYEEMAKKVLVSLLANDRPISAIMGEVGEKNKNRFRQNVLNPLIEALLLEPTIKDKPTSSKQTYRLTDKARRLMNVQLD